MIKPVKTIYWYLITNHSEEFKLANSVVYNTNQWLH